MEIKYEFEQNLAATELADVFKKSGIRRPVEDLGFDKLDRGFIIGRKR